MTSWRWETLRCLTESSAHPKAVGNPMSMLLQAIEEPENLKTSKPLQEGGISGRRTGQGWRIPGASVSPGTHQHRDIPSMLLYFINKPQVPPHRLGSLSTSKAV